MGRDDLYRANVLAERTAARADDYIFNKMGSALSAAQRAQSLAHREREQDRQDQLVETEQQRYDQRWEAEQDAESFDRKMALRDANRLERQTEARIENSAERLKLEQGRYALDETAAEINQRYSQLRFEEATRLAGLKEMEMRLGVQRAQSELQTAQARRMLDRLQANQQSRNRPYVNKSGDPVYDVLTKDGVQQVKLDPEAAKLFMAQRKGARAEALGEAVSQDPEVAWEQRWRENILDEINALTKVKRPGGGVSPEVMDRLERLTDELRKGPPPSPHEIEAAVRHRMEKDPSLSRERALRIVKSYYQSIREGKTK